VTQARVVHVFPAFSTGGPEVRTAVLINAMTEFKHTIISLSGDQTGRTRLEAPESISFVEAPPQSGVARLRALAGTLRRQRPNLLVTYGWGGTDAILAARLGGLAPPVHVEDGFLPDEAHGQKFLRLQARRLAFRLAADLLVPSRTLQRVATATWWLPPRRVHFFPNGVDTNRFTPVSADHARAARDQLGYLPGEVVIGTVGMLRPDKNHARLIRAFSTLARQRPARLLIVGDGECRGALEALTRELDIADRVTFTGAVIDPSRYYWPLDIFALSSDTEQMPLSILEAMASGLPVVSTAVGDVLEMVGASGAGLVSPLRDEGALTKNLLVLSSDIDLRRRLGSDNRARALAQFSLSRMIESYRDVFRRRIAPCGLED
jgi:glycosyltransferase involved in cell wall biosynthesis